MNKQSDCPQQGGQLDTQTFYVQARNMVSDLYPRNEKRYWVELIFSVTLGYGFASVFLLCPMNSWISWIGFLVGGVLVYRSSLFVHEIVHFPSNSMRRFRNFWDLLVGFPMMIPSFSYTSHTHHHSSRQYGTEEDGEYLALASGTFTGILMFLAQIIFQPVLVFGRYLILTPISFLHPRLRSWTLTHASSLVINLRFENHVREFRHSRADTAWELASWLFSVVLIGSLWFGILPRVWVIKIWMMAMFVLTLNHIRTLAAHRYRNDGETMSHLDQFLDSINVSGNWLTELICPLGLRYHALHHLFPGIPFHNLGIAHRRLTSLLPANSPYHDVTYPNLRSVIKELYLHVLENRRR